MTEVSSCHPTVEEGQYVQKGDQLGYFQYGGSSYAMVFDRELELEFNPEIYIPNEKGMVDLQPVNSHLATFK
jgi:phosphatidylserine decarboxylase